MIGKPITTEEFQKLLERQGLRDKFLLDMEEELKAIKLGECLCYETVLTAPLWASVGLTLLVNKVEGLKMIREGNYTYIYRDDKPD